MKKIITIIALLVTSLCFADGMKVGVLDFQRIVSESKAAKKMNENIEKQFQSRQTEILEIQSTLESTGKELQRNGAVMKEAQVEEMQNKIASLRRDLERKGEDFQRDLRDAQEKASKKFTMQVEKEVQKIGKADGFDLILQKQATAYIRNELDVTDKIIGAL